MSTTEQLERWATENNPLYQNAMFIGVFASDKLQGPKTAAKWAPAALIIIYEPRGLPGRH